MKNKTLALFVFACLAISIAFANVPGLFSTITASQWISATNGYQVNGSAGSSGQALCSDGTYFDTPCSLSGTPYYQTINLNGTGGYTQQPVLNFTGGLFSITNNSGNTAVGLISSGTGGIVATITSTPGASTAAAVFDGLGNIIPATFRVTNCLTTGASCVGGTDYVSGTTYPNGLGIPIEEEVGMVASGGSCTGADSELTYMVSGSARNGNGVWNQCNGVASVTFIVAPGATFSATATHIDGGGSASITSWYETTLP